MYGVALALALSLTATLRAQDLYVVSRDSETIKGAVGEYTTSGAVDASLISGLNVPGGIAISPVPEPSTIALAGLGAVAFCFWWRWR